MYPPTRHAYAATSNLGIRIYEPEYDIRFLVPFSHPSLPPHDPSFRSLLDLFFLSRCLPRAQVGYARNAMPGYARVISKFASPMHRHSARPRFSSASRKLLLLLLLPRLLLATFAREPGSPCFISLACGISIPYPGVSSPPRIIAVDYHCHLMGRREAEKNNDSRWILETRSARIELAVGRYLRVRYGGHYFRQARIMIPVLADNWPAAAGSFSRVSTERNDALGSRSPRGTEIYSAC